MNQIQYRYTGWQFIDCVVIYTSRNTVEDRTVVIFRTDTGKPFCTFVTHGRYMCKSFHIVDGSRAGPQSSLCREGRFNTGIAALAFNGFEHRSLFSADISSSSGNNIEVTAKVGS